MQRRALGLTRVNRFQLLAMRKRKLFAFNSQIIILAIHGTEQGMYVHRDYLKKLVIIGVSLR